MHGASTQTRPSRLGQVAAAALLAAFGSAAVWCATWLLTSSSPEPSQSVSLVSRTTDGQPPTSAVRFAAVEDAAGPPSPQTSALFAGVLFPLALSIVVRRPASDQVVAANAS